MCITKNCKVCKTDKPVTDFYPSKGCSLGVRGTCKSCCLEKQKQQYHDSVYINKKHYADANKEKIQEYQAEYRDGNRDRIEALSQQWRENNKDYISEKQKEYRQKNTDTIKSYMKEYRETNKEYCASITKQWREKNPDLVQKYRDNYSKTHKDEIAERRRIREKELRKNNPVYRLHHNISRGISRSLNGTKQGRKWESLVGYTDEELMEHLQSRFVDGMNWTNYGKEWHVDHIIPKSHFTILDSNCPEFQKCWSLSNLQPMWARDNMSKQDRYIG